MPRRARDVVLFDLDGVLVDSRVAIAGCINHALVANGLPPHPESELHRFIGPPLAAVFAELTSKAIGSPLVSACLQSYRQRYAVVSLRETVAIPGIAAALAELARHHRLAVATSKPVAFAEPILESVGLRRFFEMIAGPDVRLEAEHKAATIGGALKTLNVLDSRRVVMVGDRSFDIVGAHAHGLAAAGVTWGIGSAHELTSAGADTIIDDPLELPAALTSLLALVR